MNYVNNDEHYIVGYVKTYEELLQLIQDFEMSFAAKFAKYMRCPKEFGQRSKYFQIKKILRKDVKAELCYNMYLYITAWEKEMAKIQLEESKGKGGRHKTLTCDQVSTIPIVERCNLPKDILTGGMSFDCQLGPGEQCTDEAICSKMGKRAKCKLKNQFSNT